MTLSITMLCHFAEYRVLFIFILNVIRLSVIMLNVVMLSAIVLGVVAPSMKLYSKGPWSDCLLASTSTLVQYFSIRLVPNCSCRALR
jgi:hypothetical protein